MGADAILIIGAALVGLCLGSFLNVCILRLWHEDRKRRSLLHPPSTCPNCKQRIAWRDNIPVFSWLWLRGKCRWCRKPISIQYPIIEAFVALLWVVSLLVYGPSAKAVAANCERRFSPWFLKFARANPRASCARICRISE